MCEDHFRLTSSISSHWAGDVDNLEEIHIFDLSNLSDFEHAVLRTRHMRTELFGWFGRLLKRHHSGIIQNGYVKKTIIECCFSYLDHALSGLKRSAS